MILLKDGAALFMLCISARREALNKPIDSTVAAQPCAYLKGIYKVVNDTIRLQLSTDNRWGWADWWTEENWFKITSKNTLQYLGSYNPRNGFTTFVPDKLNKRIYTFYPTRTLPSSKDIWLTQEEWFTCEKKE